VFSRDELIARFTLEGISGGNAVFNPEKLTWFNQQHIMRLSADELLSRLRPALAAAGLWHDDFENGRRQWMARVIDLLKPRAHRLGDFVTQLRPFVADRIERDPAAVDKHLTSAQTLGHLAAWRDRMVAADSFEAAPLEAALRALADERGVKAGPLIHATRVAVVGQVASPGLFEVLELVGRDRVLARIDDVLMNGAEKAPAEQQA
jgi:glutamyl-tRNA synthetase